jgi:hypothetical protein
MGVTCGTGTVHPSGTAEFALGFPHVLVGFVLVKYMLLLIWFRVVMYGTISALKMIFSSSLLPFALSEIHVLLMLFVFIYVCWCPTGFIWHVSMSGRQTTLIVNGRKLCMFLSVGANIKLSLSAFRIYTPEATIVNYKPNRNIYDYEKNVQTNNIVSIK